MTIDDPDFYASIPMFYDFADAMKRENYRPLPDDWVVGFSDVVGSTLAVAAGRYKAVNMAGAGVIASVANALRRRPFPFVFGGDGASFAVAPPDANAAREALAAMATFASAEYGLELRVAMAPVATIRAAGRDLRVARYGASPDCAFAMFAGGGLAWLEAAAKRGEFAVPPAASGARPDLTGLSCRFGAAEARHGLILSLIVAPRADEPRFAALLDEIVGMALAEADGGRPITLDNLSLAAPTEVVRLEAVRLEAAALRTPRLAAWLAAFGRYAMSTTFLSLRLKVGGVDANHYLGEVVANADFRKFDDGLRMTLDCSSAFADALEARLAAASDYADYGTFRQAAAQLTCYTPSVRDRGHVHFVDGAGGGYTMAAKAMKARREARTTPPN